jgi:phenylalanine-4-hydroxylase
MAIVLTKRQREVLQMMADGEELVQDRSGKGWPQYWIGYEQTTHGVWWALVENVLISCDGGFDKRTIYWYINESGQMLLKGETKIYPIYNKKGLLEYVEEWRK